MNLWLPRKEIMRRIRAAVPEMPRDSVADWCVDNVRFDEAGNRGPFRLTGFEYLREPLEDWNRSDVQDSVLVFGTQSGKTSLLMAGMAWCLVRDPCGFLVVFPSITLAQRFSRQRFMKMLRRTKATMDLVPTGADRFDFATCAMLLGSSSINVVGSNSAANLASFPCRRVVLDEVEKFNEGTDREASAVSLAENRTKKQPSPQRWKTSSPTTDEGPIWQEYLKGDQRRYFLHCPTCGKEILPIWSPQYSVLPRQGCEASVMWPKHLKRGSGKWNLDEVERQSYLCCPHCAAEIRDHQKPRMVAGGVWRPTAPGAPNFVSRQLSSLYAVGPETAWGRLAVMFLQGKDTMDGIKDFVSNYLAEPYMSQDVSRVRRELITERIELSDKPALIMTVDCQAKSPAFWCVVRDWRPGACVGVAAGSADSWQEIESTRASHSVDPSWLFVDSGYGARSEADVYGECARHSETIMHQGRNVLFGWCPMKGQPTRKRWYNEPRKANLPWMTRSIDPYEGSNLAGLATLDLLEFSADTFKDWLAELRNPEKAKGFKWSVAAEMATDEYWRHMDGEHLVSEYSKQTGRSRVTWKQRGKNWPNHLFDCEVMQLVAASYLGLFNAEVTQ